MRDTVVRTAIENIDLVSANLSLSKIENELLSDRGLHYYLADKLEAVEAEHDFDIVDASPNLGLATWSILTASDGIIIPFFSGLNVQCTLPLLPQSLFAHRSWLQSSLGLQSKIFD